MWEEYDPRCCQAAGDFLGGSFLALRKSSAR
jgi:hypothetical protein